MKSNDSGTAELIGLVREMSSTINALASRVDRHMSETNTRIEAMQLDVAAEKKSANGWLTSWFMSLDDLKS